MNSCLDKEKMIFYLLDILKEKEKFFIEKHLKECIKCQNELKIERKIDDNLSWIINTGNMEKEVLEKIKRYKEISKFSIFLKPLRIFLLSTAFTSVLLAFWDIFLNFQWEKFSTFFSSEEFKGYKILFSNFAKEISVFFNLNVFDSTIHFLSLLFFIFNFLYALKKYLCKEKLV